MTAEQRLADVLSALEAINLRPLVMGGHAVRYFGLARMTDDFDMHLAPDGFDSLSERLEQSAWFRARKPIEVPSWRSDAFRRFQIGTLPNGREEWLEFWKENHLLPPYSDAYQRRESGLYGGRICDFLSLPDLIRAKETERDYHHREQYWCHSSHVAVRSPNALRRMRHGSSSGPTQTTKGLRAASSAACKTATSLSPDATALPSAKPTICPYKPSLRTVEHSAGVVYWPASAE